jgi:hypothetical protein
MIIEGLVKNICILIVVDKRVTLKHFDELSAKYVSWKYEFKCKWCSCKLMFMQENWIRYLLYLAIFVKC